MNQGDFAGFDHHDPALDGEERYRRYAELRTCPVGRSEAHGGFSIVARHAEVEAVCKGWATFSSGHGVFLPGITAGARSAGLEQDPPEHGPVRQLFVEMLGRPLVRAAEPALAALARRYMGDYGRSGGGDYVAQVAAKVPVEAIALMAGFSPPLATRVRQLTEELWARLTGRAEAPPPGAPTLGRLLVEELDERRAQPRDDFLTRLASAHVDGEPLSNCTAASARSWPRPSSACWSKSCSRTTSSWPRNPPLLTPRRVARSSDSNGCRCD